MKQISIGDFVNKLQLKESLRSQFVDIKGHVSKVNIRKNGTVTVSCLLESPCDPDLLCSLEEALEQVWSACDVIISQRFPQKMNAAESACYAAALGKWLIRHLWHEDALVASLLQDAVFSVQGEAVQLLLSDASRQVVTQQHLRQLETMMKKHINADLSYIIQPDGEAKEDLCSYAHRMSRDHRERANRAHTSGKEKRKEMTAANNHQQQTKPMINGSVKNQPERRKPRQNGVAWGRINSDLTRVPIVDLNSETGLALIEGQIFDFETRTISDGTRRLFKFSLTDFTSSISCILFARPADEERIQAELADGAVIAVAAEISFDAQFSKDLQARVLGIQKAKPFAKRTDSELLRRIELHAHTKMSAKDATCGTRELVECAAFMGHEAVAITDHGVVQAFPEAAAVRAELQKKGTSIKIIYGLEGYLVDDGQPVAWHCEQTTLAHGFVAIDVETTGLDPATDRLIEIAAVRFEPDGQGGFIAGDRLCQLVNPGIPVSEKSQMLTGITTEMIAGAPSPLSVLEKLNEWIGDRPVVGHNVFFDINFLRYEGIRTEKDTDPKIKFNPPLIDTLALARLFLPDLKNHRLGQVAEHLRVPLDQAHRAESDALACGMVFSQLWQRSQVTTIDQLNQLAGCLGQDEVVGHNQTVYHVILQAKDRLGLYHLYRIVSDSHLNFFHMRPRIPRSLLTYYKAGLIVGSACERGEIFQSALNAYRSSYDVQQALQQLRSPEALRLARFYDYFEIQPLDNNAFYLRNPDSGLTTTEDLQKINRVIFEWGRQMKKWVCATGDVHFVNPDDEIYRRLLMHDMGYDDADQPTDLSYKTTGEMLDAFAYLGETNARMVVIDHPAAIAAQISANLKPFPDGSFPPLIEQAADEVRNLTWSAALAVYGREGQVPETVRDRIERELASIIENGFAVMYYISHKLVKKSNEDGYIVGSRGSVGSSLVATLCGITEVNPLPPHHVCPHCHHSIFDQTGTFGSGYDLPPRDCPDCGHVMNRDGQDIPFETFLGFNGDKQPDIDLNFSGEYQPRAHRFIEEMFGSSHTFRAGTISSYAEKNAQAIVRKYYEDHSQFVTQAEIRRLSQGLIGVKRTTGQHPGGIVVVPKEREIYDFTPVQHPADKRINGTITTHFDFNAMHETILKLDILGHDDPTMLKMLGDMTGVDVAQIPIPDPRVMSLFQSTEALGIAPGEATDDCATLGLPEMGTFMARDMIRETRPGRFYDLVQLMGLSHGTDVWKGNAQELIQSGTCTIEDVIGCRDSIMTGLIYNGLAPKMAFDIMERVRKGRGLTEEHEAEMRAGNVPEWYIESCKKIRYMFPKAHAVAYTISTLRIAYFKVYYPEAYYCSYFTVRADEFDSSIMCRPHHQIRQARKDLRKAFRTSTDREQRIYYILELVEEMQLRGIDFVPVDLHQSDATRFQIVATGRILPPLNAIPSVSAAVAEQIVKARQDGNFKTQEDLMRRSGIGQAVLESLAASGCLDGMPESSQLDLFQLF